MAKQLQDIIREFVAKKSKYRGYETKTVRNLLIGQDDKPSFFWNEIGCIRDCENFDEYDKRNYRYAVRDSVISYSSTKDSAIEIFKKLTEYIEKEMSCTIPIQYPPIPVSNTFERLMFIAKYFHDDKGTVAGLTDELWVGERTIASDLAKLRGFEDPIQICGRTFKLEEDEIEREDGTMKFKSTVHPFFLTCNLTQVVAMLKGLDRLSDLPEWRGYTKPLSNQIWEQLSDYGKQRIRTVLTELMPEEKDLLDRLEAETSGRSFYSESYCTSLGQNALYECMKGAGPCIIEYKTEDGTEFIENVKLLQEKKDTFVVEINDERRELERNKILRSSRFKERLFS